MKKIIRLIGVAVFVFILLKINLTESLGIISGLNITYLMISILLIFPQLLIKSWRWKYILKLQSVDYKLKDSFLAYLSGIYIGMITPGRIGEIIKVFYLKRAKKTSFGFSLSSVFLDRFFDLLVFILIGVFGVFFFGPLFEGYFAIVLVFLIALFVLAVLILRKGSTSRVLRIAYSYLLPKKYKKFAKREFHGFCDGVRMIKSYKLLMVFMVSLVVQLIYVLQGYALLLSLNIEMPYIYLLVCMSVMSLAVLIPVSILGIGTRDVTLIVFFSVLGLSAENAISFSLMLLFINYLIQGSIGAFSWFKKPIDMSLK